jgi:hypothetical protein
MTRAPAPLLLAALFSLATFAAPFASASEEIEPLGFLRERDDGTFLNVFVDGTTFAVQILDSEKRVRLPVPFDRARIRYRSATTREREAYLTRTGDGLALRGPHVVNRPYSFNFWLTLFEPSSAEVNEFHSGRIVQLANEEPPQIPADELAGRGLDPSGQRR